MIIYSKCTSHSLSGFISLYSSTRHHLLIKSRSGVCYLHFLKSLLLLEFLQECFVLFKSDLCLLFLILLFYDHSSLFLLFLFSLTHLDLFEHGCVFVIFYMPDFLSLRSFLILSRVFFEVGLIYDGANHEPEHEKRAEHVLDIVIEHFRGNCTVLV